MRMKILAALIATAVASPLLAHGTSLLPIETVKMREGHREAAIARRAEFMKRMKGGLAVITSHQQVDIGTLAPQMLELRA